MTVQELMERLEEMPSDAVVVIDGGEATDIVLRDEVYLSENYVYQEGLIVKIV